jgi:hypothetical protein
MAGIIIAAPRAACTGEVMTIAIISTDHICAGNTVVTGTIMTGEIIITGEITVATGGDKDGWVA